MEDKVEKIELSDYEKEQAAIRLLKKLENKLYSDNYSVARKTAYNLSWLQEDGMEILEKALFGKTQGQTKHAAAYGLRSMRGRMKAQALKVLYRGLIDDSDQVKRVCQNTFELLKHRYSKKHGPGRQNPYSQIQIRAVPPKKRPNRQDRQPRRPDRQFNRR